MVTFPPPTGGDSARKLLEMLAWPMEHGVLPFHRIDEVTFETCPLLATGGT